MKYQRNMDLQGFSLLLHIVVLYISRYSYQLRYVKNCPTTAGSRKQHSDILNCTLGSSVNVYHCLPTNKNRLMELCFDELALSSKDGCPYFTEDEERIEIQQKECTGSNYGCPEAIKDPTILSSEAYMFPLCLSVPVKTTKTRESSTKTSIPMKTYEFAEVNDSRRTQIHPDSATTNGSTATVKGLLLTNPIFLLGVSLFALICVLVGCIIYNLYRRITEIRLVMEADIEMISDQYSAAMTQPYQESENEVVYDYVNEEDEISRPTPESGKAKLCSCCRQKNTMVPL